MDLVALQQAVPDLRDRSHYDRIKIFGWWIHVYKSQETFTGADIAKCYDALHYSKPASFGAYISQLFDKKELLKELVKEDIPSGESFNGLMKCLNKVDGDYDKREVLMELASKRRAIIALIKCQAETHR